MKLYCTKHGEFMKLFYTKRGKNNQTDEANFLLEIAFHRCYTDNIPEIKKTPNGKPYFNTRSDIHFSLSHSKTHIICALSSSPVGVDIESERSINERTKEFFCSPDELIHFTPLELWVLKESYIKLFGTTIADLKNLRFSKINDKIIAPDKTVKSHLLKIDNCYAAISAYGDFIIDSIRKV